MFDQAQSTQRLHANIETKFKEVFPQEYNGHIINVSNITFKEPKGDYKDQNEAFLNESDLATLVKGDITITKDGETVMNSKNVTFASVPFVTNRGTYIVGGNENVFINQMVLRPGVYVNPKRHLSGGDFIAADVRAGKQRLKIIFNETKGTLRLEGLGLEYGHNGKKVDVIPLLNFLGVSDTEIQKAIGDEEMFNSLKASSSTVGAEKIFKALSTEEYQGEEEARSYIEDHFKTYLTFDDRAKKVSKAMIGAESDSLDKTILLSTLTQMFKENREPGVTPDVDDYRFKEVRNSEDVIANGVELGIKEWTKKVKERIRQNRVKPENTKPLGYFQKELKGLYSSNLMEGVDSGNPLDLHQKRHKVTQFGPGGLTDRSLSESNRNLQDTAFSKIDPVETPQSGKLGATQHLAKDAVILNGTIYSKFYKVKGGKVDRSKVLDRIDPLDEYEEYIAFNNPQTLDKENGWKFKEANVMVRHKGDFIEVPSSKVTLIDVTPSSHLGHATALIPFGANNDGARMLMGSSMQRQALALENPDEPLVQSVSDEASGKTMEAEMADNASFLLKAPVAGTVSAIEDDFIEIASEDGKKTKVEKLNYFSTGKQGGYINHKPVVKVGDTVEPGALLADGWQSKNGKLSLGKNTRVAYMPYEGYNFEDGVVVSESFAQKMASEEMKTIEYEIVYDDDTLNQPESKKKLKELLVSDAVLSKLDANGIIKKGATVSSGDIFVASVKHRKKAEASAAERLLSRTIITSVKDLYVDKSKYVQGYQKGKILEVSTVKRGETLKVSIKMLSFKPMEIGDKLSGRHGNKGTITKILPDAEMPHTEDKEPVELIFSPLAVPSRKNMGQLLEVNAGLIAQKKGLSSYNVNNFDKDSKDKVLRELEEIGIPDGKQTLINPKTGKAFENPVTVGPMYVMKLKHSVEGKISARNFEGAEDPVTAMPKKVSGAINGDRHSPQGVGGMEFWSLTSAGAVENIHEMTTLKSDGSGSAEDKMARLNIYQAIRNGTTIPEPVTPQTLKVLQEQLYGAGLQITPMKKDKKVTLDEKFTSLMLQPISPQQLEDLGAESVKGSKTIDSRTGEPDKEGLYSKDVFGDNGEKWGKIDLGAPIPNPVFLNNNSSVRPYESMLLSKGIPQSKIIDIVEKGKYLILDPKETGYKKYDVVSSDVIEELVDIEEVDLEYATGGAALSKLLEDVDLKQELTIAEQGLKEAKDANQRSKYQRHVRTLSAGLDNGYKPKDYMLPFVPVLPVKYREPVKTNNSDQVAEDGITLLYQSLMKKNSELDKTIEAYEGNIDMIDKVALADLEADRYKMVKNIMGVGAPYKDQKKNIEYDGILHRMSSKQGFLREKMQKKLQDYSGRSVIVVDPELSMDETGIPEDMAAEIFAPKIERELQRDRYTPKEIIHHMKERDEPFRRALSRAVEDEVVILNRQPSLHRHSLQAFKPVIRWDSATSTNRAIGLNPIVTTGFNADFDGDTMAVHVPITDAARKEAKEKLMPSQNLLNPTNNSLIMDLKHEMQLGIYYMTRDRIPTGEIKDFKDAKELRKAYEKGEVKTYDSVRITVPRLGTVISTAGKHLFNSALPPAYMDYKDHVDMKKGDIEKLLFRIMDDPKHGQFGAVRVINDLKNLGFKSSTNSGVSIGIKDFDPVSSIDKNKLFEEAGNDVSIAPFIDQRDEYEQKKMEYVQSKVKDIINSGILGQDNPVEIMRASGARGNAGQISAMSAMVGTGKDVTSVNIRPVKSSLLEGTTPNEFWDLSNDSRKGIYDRSVASEKPGELTRYVWLSNKQTIITEKDCGDTQGITLNLNTASDAKALYGRILIDDVALKGGGVIKAKKNVPLSRAEYEKIKNEATNKSVRVRSPLACKSSKGVCQYCYGAKPGAIHNDLVPIGEPIGSIAAQAIGEPSQQAIMKTFHTGAGNSNVSSTFESVDNILSLKSDIPNKAILAEMDGTVTSMINDPVTGTTVKVGNKKYKLGKLQPADGLRVGTVVKMGESLTKEYDIATKTQLSIRDPRDVLKYEGIDATREYLTRQVDNAFMSGDINNIDRRHMEVVVGNMTNKAVINDGGTSGFIPQQVAQVKTLQHMNSSNSRVMDVSLDFANRMNVVGSVAAATYHERPGKSGRLVVSAGETITDQHWEQLRKNRKYIKVRKRKVEFTPELQNVRKDAPSDNWLERSSRGDSRKVIGEGASMFMNDQLDNPLTRQMTGLKGNFSTGFQDWAADMKDRFGNLF